MEKSQRSKLDSIIRHIENVKNNTEKLAGILFDAGQEELARDLIARGLRHDNSKLTSEIEWSSLGSPDKRVRRVACTLHYLHNDHHPEHWWGQGGIHGMSDAALAEMVCDWHARSSEFGSDLLSWIETVAMERFGFKLGDEVCGKLTRFVGLLLDERFAR